MSDWEWFRGDFAAWPDAAAQSGGYADPAILERVVTAARAVRDGRAAYERDGVAFAAPRVHHALLAALFRTALGAGGGLRVADVGGGLGSLYWQHRRWLAAIAPLSWWVVEQPHYVAAGRREFATPALSFSETLAEAWVGGVDIALLSSVVQYVPEPYGLLQDVLSREPEWLLVDRLPLLPGSRDRLCIECVPAEVGAASYPAWFLAEERFRAAVGPSYEWVDEFPTLLEHGVAECWRVFGATVANRGFLLRRRP